MMQHTTIIPSYDAEVSFKELTIYQVRNKDSNIELTCCLKRSALEALLAKISSPETKRSSR